MTSRRRNTRGRQPRQPGQLKGRIWIADDFDETDAEIADAFDDSGGQWSAHVEHGSDR